MVIRHWVFMLFTLSCSTALAQDFHSDFDKIHKTFYAEGKTVSFNVTFYYYANSKSTVCTDTMSGHYSMRGSSYRYLLAGVDILHNDRYFIVANQDNKTITIDPSKSNNIPAYSFAFVDSLLSQSKVTVGQEPTTGGLQGYRVEGLKGDIKAMTIWFNPTSYRLSKVVLQFNQRPDPADGQPRVEVVYNRYKVTESTALFSENNLIQKTGIKWYPTSAYSKYQLIDHTMFKP